MDNNILGKGLKSLIPEEVKEGLKTKENVLYLKISEIEIDEHQPRKTLDSSKISELAQSIKEHGIIQPLVVSKNKDAGFHLIAGQRRLRAAEEAGLSDVPAIVKNVEASQKLEMSLIENIQREDLGPLEEAEAYQVLVKKFNLTTDKIAQKVGKGETTVVNSIRLLGLPQEIKDALGQNLLSVGHAKAILTLPREVQLKLLPEIRQKRLTVRDIESRSKNYHDKKNPAKQKTVDDFQMYLSEISGNLREIFQTKVVVKKKGKGGEVVIDFYSKEELERLLEYFSKIKSHIEGEK